MTDEQKIRAARKELNDAIIGRNTAAFARYWLEDAQITAGSGQTLGSSRAGHVKRFVATFADPAFVNGVRNTTRVDVSEDSTIAAEHGEWSWQYRVGAELQDSQGTYLVMWRKKGSDWRIQSELYVMLRCDVAK